MFWILCTGFYDSTGERRGVGVPWGGWQTMGWDAPQFAGPPCDRFVSLHGMAGPDFLWRIGDEEPVELRNRTHSRGERRGKALERRATTLPCAGTFLL